MATRIRRARASDSEILTRLAHTAKRYWGYPEGRIRLWKADLTLTPEFVGHNAVYCAVRGSRVVGFYALSESRGAAELEHMWVHPTCIGSGVGTLLFTHLVRRLRAMGVPRLKIASDPNAEGFYRRMEIGRASCRERV